MNGIQNFSKRIRKRIQNSVKRLFSNKTPESDEEVAQKSSDLLKPNAVDLYPNGSYDSFQGTSSGDQHINERSKMSKKNNFSEDLKLAEKFPSKSKENLRIEMSCNEMKSGKSNEIKMHTISKSTSIKSQSSRYKTTLVCPTGRHTDINDDDLCVCIHVEQLLFYQIQPIIYEWHKFKSEPTSLDSLKLEYPTTCIQGGQGVVFWVYDMKNNRHLALKMKLRETKSKCSWLIEQRESKVLKEIQHNFIVNLFHVHESTDAMFMTMEYLDGGCLWSHIAKKGTLPESYTIYYTACIIDALKYLHQLNIVYRDLKAENIVLDALGRPKLIDFGMAKKIGNLKKNHEHLNNEEEMEKYPATQYYFAAYLAPEIYSQPSSANIFIDSWGIGYVVSELLLGYGVFIPMPWENLDNKIAWRFKFNDDFAVSTQCIDFLEKMLRFNPASRMSMEDAINHPFFQQVHWSTLVYIKPPNLSIFRSRIKNSKMIRAVLSSDDHLPSLFEFCDLQLPDPLLTPMSKNQYNKTFYEAKTPNDTPVNPNAPSIRLPIFVRKENQNNLKYKNMSNNLKYDIYRALCVNNGQMKKMTVDTISNLRPSKRF